MLLTEIVMSEVVYKWQGLKYFLFTILKVYL